MRTGTLGLSMRYLVLIVLTLMVLLPFASIVLAALHPSGSAVSGVGLPETWNWENFALAWEAGGYSDLMRSSFIISGGVVPLVAICATLAGYGLGVLAAWGGRHISILFVLGLTLPVELSGIALYYTLSSVGLMNNYLGVILAEVALFLPFGVYWMQSHFSSLPKELIEAGRVDSARDFTVLGSVLLPISWHAMGTLAVLMLMWSWNMYLQDLVYMLDPSIRSAT